MASVRAGKIIFTFILLPLGMMTESAKVGLIYSSWLREVVRAIATFI